MRQALLTFAAIVLCSPPGKAETWVKVKSPHFTIITDAGERDARQVAVGFEEIHAVFSVALAGLRTDASAETIVVAPKDRKSFEDLMPSEKKISEHLAGQFIKGWEKDYVIVRLDFPEQERETVYHEYIHKLLHLNFTRMPEWLDEGLAEFFGNTQMRSDGIFVGAPSPRISILKSGTPFPLHTLISSDAKLMDFRDQIKIQMFYAQAWALTHFLMFGDNMGNGKLMNAYLHALQSGTKSEKAFADTFGDPAQLDASFAHYISQFSFRALRLDKLPKADPSQFAGGQMSAAETDARLGGFYSYVHQTEIAKERLTAALSADPKSAIAHENQGFLYFQEGRDEDAKKEFDQAVTLEPNSYLALYYQAMMEYHRKTDADSLAKLSVVLDRVLALNPSFAPAIVVKSQVLVRQGKLQDGFDTAVQAAKLEPDRAGYQTNLAEILVLGHNYPNAIKIASVVAERWTSTDSAEALAVLDQARQLGKVEPTVEEKSKEADEMKYAQDTTAVEGTIKSTNCEKSKPMEIELQRGDETLNFRAGKQFGMGFSDTLWYGADHFTACHHLEGMSAVVRYKPSPDPSAENEFRWLEIRDELTPSAVSSGTEKQTTQENTLPPLT